MLQDGLWSSFMEYRKQGIWERVSCRWCRAMGQCHVDGAGLWGSVM